MQCLSDAHLTENIQARLTAALPSSASELKRQDVLHFVKVSDTHPSVVCWSMAVGTDVVSVDF